MRSVSQLRTDLLKKNQMDFLQFFSCKIYQPQNIQIYINSSITYHQDQLQKHCRICGGRLNKAKGKAQTVHACKEHFLDLQTFVGILSNPTEEEFIAPSKLCNPCFLKLRRVKMASKDGLPSHSMVAMEWTPHQEECKVTEN